MGKYVKYRVVCDPLEFDETYTDFKTAKHDYFRLEDPKSMIGFDKYGTKSIVYSSEKIDKCAERISD